MLRLASSENEGAGSGTGRGLTDGGLISAGLMSVRASVTNLLRPVEEWHCGGTPIPSMMNFERRKGK